MAKTRRKVYDAEMDEGRDEGRKRVIAIIAGIIVARNLERADDLFGGPQGSPRTDKMIAAADFNGEPVPAPDSWDGNYIRDVRMCLTGEDSRCGLAPQLFPLTSEEQKKYDFRLIGQEILRGRDAHHIGFVPKKQERLYLGRRGVYRCHRVSAGQSIHEFFTAGSVLRAQHGDEPVRRWLRHRVQATGGRKLVANQLWDGV
jgi:hypothetical protein